MQKYTVLILSGLLAVGCAKNITPPVREFTVTPPPRWTTAGTLPGVVESKWWIGFGDPGLEKAIVEALANNHDLQSAAARVEAVHLEARMAGAGRYPNVGVRLSRGRQRQNFVGLPIPGSEDSVLSTTYTSAGVSLDLSWELDVWGRLKAGHQVALATAEARQADWVGARLSLSGQTAKAWFAAVEAERQVGLARAQWESARLSGARVRERFERGLRPSLDLRLALTEVARAEAALRQRREQRDRAVRQLEILLGHYPRGDYALGEDLPTAPAQVPAGLPSELVHRRPDLIASERELLAADARFIQSKAELRPMFALTTAGGTTSNRLRELVDPQFMAWNLVGSLTQPLFQGG
ncbi:MAG: TolC family protein, partial [bacterium]|nr:TolC family protein [bacterium]